MSEQTGGNMTISRRGFVAGSVAAAMSTLLPSWRLFKQRRTIDLMPFCDDKTFHRYNLTKPFAQDGQVYATDGSVCVRTTLAEAPALGEGVRLPAASKLPWWSLEADWKPYPKRRLIVDPRQSRYPATCPNCDGKGGLAGLAACANCDGGAIVTDFWNPETSSLDCPTCRGTGWTCTVLCDYCEGTGETRRPSVQPIGDLLSILTEAPEPMPEPVERINQGNWLEPRWTLIQRADLIVAGGELPSGRGEE